MAQKVRHRLRPTDVLEAQVQLNPPKSISILGQTGWETARTTKTEGGGRLMA